MLYNMKKLFLCLLLVCFQAYSANFTAQVTETLRFLNARSETSIMAPFRNMATTYIANEAGSRCLSILSKHRGSHIPSSEWYKLAPFLSAYAIGHAIAHSFLDYGLTGQVSVKNAFKTGFFNTATRLMVVAVNKIHGSLPPRANLLQWQSSNLEDSIAAATLTGEPIEAINAATMTLTHYGVTRILSRLF